MRRPRTSSGKSVSLHPSAELLARWHEFAYRANRRVRGCARSQGAKAANGSWARIVAEADVRHTAPSASLVKQSEVESRPQGVGARRSDVHGDAYLKETIRDDPGRAHPQPRAIDRPFEDGGHGKWPNAAIEIRHRRHRLSLVRRDGVEWLSKAAWMTSSPNWVMTSMTSTQTLWPAHVGGAFNTVCL